MAKIFVNTIIENTKNTIPNLSQHVDNNTKISLALQQAYITMLELQLRELKPSAVMVAKIAAVDTVGRQLNPQLPQVVVDGEDSYIDIPDNVKVEKEEVQDGSDTRGESETETPEASSEA